MLFCLPYEFCRDDGVGSKIPWLMTDHDHNSFGSLDELSRAVLVEDRVRGDDDETHCGKDESDDALVDAVATGASSAGLPRDERSDPFHVR